MAAAAAAAARHASEVSVSRVADDDAEEAIVAEEVFLRAAARGGRGARGGPGAGSEAISDASTVSAVSAARVDFEGWIGGRPSGEGVAVFPSSASLATVSSDDEGADARRGSAAPPRVVAFDDSDDGDASDDDVGRGPPLVVRGPGAARYGSADAVDASAASAAAAALSNSFDDYGVAEEHEAAMTHLLSASVGARTYGATTTTTITATGATTRDAFDDEDTGDVAGSGARHIGGVASRNGNGNGPVVRFGNAIPAATVTGTVVDSEVSAAFKRRRGGGTGTDGAVAFANALPRIR